MKPTLLILAAGLGTRYGGLKQIDPVGPNGEIIIDYSIYDAIGAGFGKIVFVIRHCFEKAFMAKIGTKFAELVETAYAYQDTDACLDGFAAPKGRRKPWGTGHAVLVAGDVIDGPFAVINADDYYGAEAFKTTAGFLTKKHVSPDSYAMIGYTLADTLSEYGSVARGVCRCDERMFLKEIVERKKVEKTRLGVRYIDDDGAEHLLTGREVVSMNLWAFQPSVFAHLRSSFRQFLERRGHEDGSELFIPDAVDELIKSGRATVKVLRTGERWFGVTFRRDAAVATRCIAELIDEGIYPEKLWG
ncbi:MAG: hypothetical protein JSU94_21480 [Phycisphaerales bacterium]|nr:MAG: hypothetical protein JSU94_21480 [Phycisphaerales bacterium]